MQRLLQAQGGHAALAAMAIAGLHFVHIPTVHHGHGNHQAHAAIQRFTRLDYVIDGDTLVMEGQRLRLLGIDAPELAQSCQEPSDESAPCGRQARAAMLQIVSGGVTCEGASRDIYHRLLVTCIAGRADVASRMVAAGEAVATDCCTAEEALAKAARRGIWAGSFEDPADWRRDRRFGG